MSRRHSSRYDHFWPRYMPVAERRANAEKAMKKLEKKGETIRPVRIEGRTIARTFWGKGWCDHLESFGDYSNRLPRGRSYVRNGSVCHLDIAQGRIEARVAGSSLYCVKVDINPLPSAKWKAIKARCAGRIGSLIELLQGKLSDEIMGTVADRKEGLFPLPGEITYTCDCPDWAHMCKHVSAVMYGIGARLDEQPDLLFLLRGVDSNDLVSGETDAAAALAGKGTSRSRRRRMAETDLAAVFGVELEKEQPTDSAKVTASTQSSDKKSPRRPGRRKGVGRTTAKKKSPTKSTTKGTKAKTSPAPFRATGKSVRELRRRLAMSVAEFARAAGVTPASVNNWEKSVGGIRPHARTLTGLQRLHERVAGEKG